MADELILPVINQLLECFCDALVTQHGTMFMVDGGTLPGECCIRVGELVSMDASSLQDLCCSGLAWVRLTNIFPSVNDFPAPDTLVTVSGCGPQAWGITVEMGVMRCAPTGSISEIPTCGEWTALAEAIALDQRAMRDAMCCMIAQLDPSSLAIGSWSPLPTTGGCAGGTWPVTIQIINCGENC